MEQIHERTEMVLPGTGRDIQGRLPSTNFLESGKFKVGKSF